MPVSQSVSIQKERTQTDHGTIPKHDAALHSFWVVNTIRFCRTKRKDPKNGYPVLLIPTRPKQNKMCCYYLLLLFYAVLFLHLFIENYILFLSLCFYPRRAWRGNYRLSVYWIAPSNLICGSSHCNF